MKSCRMSQLYRNDSIKFRYPEGWELEEHEIEGGQTVSLQSPGSMFMLVSVYETDPSCQMIADQALDALRDEYPELESTPVSDIITQSPVVGYDVGFVALDFTNTCWIRAFMSQEQTILIFAQTNDMDLQDGHVAFIELHDSLIVTNSL